MRTSTNRIRKLVCLVIAFVIFIFPVPLSSLALEEDVSYYSVQDNLSYEVVTRIISSWDKHQNIEMTFVNTGYEVIHNWYFLYNSPYEIINIWNSEIVESDSNLTYIIPNCSYNQDIPVGGSVTIVIIRSSNMTIVVICFNNMWIIGYIDCRYITIETSELKQV